MSDMPNYDDLWDTHCKLVDHCQKLDARIERLGEIAEAAWKFRTEALDYTPCPDPFLRVNYREHLYELLDQQKAAEKEKREC